MLPAKLLVTSVNVPPAKVICSAPTATFCRSNVAPAATVVPPAVVEFVFARGVNTNTVTLSGTGEALDLQTFKLVDQISGRMMGLHADSTPQVARIDAHLLNRSGVTRLCYCGPVLHTRPAAPHATREPLQFGAEIYGHAGLEADLEVLTLTLDALKACKVGALTVDMADARIVGSLLEGQAMSEALRHDIHAALATKDASKLARLTAAGVRL